VYIIITIIIIQINAIANIVNIKKEGNQYPLIISDFIMNYNALPRGNTSSGNTKFSCGWSTEDIHALIPSLRRMFLV